MQLTLCITNENTQNMNLPGYFRGRGDLDNLLEIVTDVMKSNSAFDNVLPVASKIGKYIKGGVDDLSRAGYIDLMKKVSFADRDEIARKQETAEFESLSSRIKDEAEKERVESIRERTKSALSGIHDFQRVQSEKEAITAEKSAKFGEKLSSEQKALYNKVESMKVENEKLLETQREEFFEWLSDEREKIVERFDISKQDLSRTQQGIESVIKSIETKRFDEKQAEIQAALNLEAEIEANKPAPKQTQQVEIAETGQIITIAK